MDLITAVICDDLRAVQKLLDSGVSADSRWKSEHNVTALIDAIIRERFNIAKLLIEKGADVNLNDDLGRSALMMAASWGNLEILESLIEKGADINAQDNYGSTPLMWSIWKPDNFSVIKALLDKGADVNLVDMHGKTALMYGIENDNKLEELLRKYKARDFTNNEIEEKRYKGFPRKDSRKIIKENYYHLQKEDARLFLENLCNSEEFLESDKKLFRTWMEESNLFIRLEYYARDKAIVVKVNFKNFPKVLSGPWADFDREFDLWNHSLTPIKFV